MATSQSWRALGPELVEQMRGLMPYEADDWVREWRTRNLPLKEFLRAVWQFANAPRLRENERVFYERVDAGCGIRTLTGRNSAAGWPIATRLLQRLLVMLGGDCIPLARETGSGAGSVQDAWREGRRDQAELRTAQLLRQFGARALFPQLASSGMPAPVLTFLPSLWHLSALLQEWWPAVEPWAGLRLVTRAQASWTVSHNQPPVLLPAEEHADFRSWNDTAYIMDLIRTARQKLNPPQDIGACYAPGGAGALVEQMAQGSGNWSNRRLAALLVEASALAVTATRVTEADQVSRHLLAVMDWLRLSQFASSAPDERAAIWAAWGWFFAVALAFLPADGDVLTVAVPFDERDERILWSALQEGDAEEAVARAAAVGDVGEIWEDVEDEASVMAAPEALRMIWAYKPWLQESPFRASLLPAVIRIMAQARPALVIHGGA